MSEPACAVNPIYKMISATLVREGVPFAVEPRVNYDRFIVACRTGERILNISHSRKPHRRSIDRAETWLQRSLSDRRFPTIEHADAEMQVQVELDIEPSRPVQNSLSYEGFLIGQSGEMISLTDMWKAAGAQSGRAPTDWLSLVSTKEFVECVESSLNTENPGIQARRGGGGGTFAHWQIAIAYAKYLSPRFHMWANEAVREKMERMRAAPALAAPEPRSEVVVFDPKPVTSGVIGGLIKYLRDNVVAPFNRLIGAVTRVEDRQDALLARIAEDHGWLKERLENQHRREREMLHILRAQFGGDPAKSVDLLSDDLAGYVDIAGVYRMAGAPDKIPARLQLSGRVTRSLDAFGKKKPHHSARSRPGRGRDEITVWPKAAVAEWLVETGRQMIERHLRAHASKAELLPFPKRNGEKS